jgi:hypothetical protein
LQAAYTGDTMIGEEAEVLNQLKTLLLLAP